MVVSVIDRKRKDVVVLAAASLLVSTSTVHTD